MKKISIFIIILAVIISIFIFFTGRNHFYNITSPYDKFSAIDRILRKMEFGNIAYNIPQSMNFHDKAIIDLKLGLTTSIDELKKMIEMEGQKEGARIHVSERMEAHLVGTDFSITAITPDIQAVSRSDVTEWKWEISPRNYGHLFLHLTLSAVLSVDGTSTPRVIRTFDKKIEVKVTWGQRISSFFEKNWQWLWAAILVPLVGWIWRTKQKKTLNKTIDG
jgi:hypothetical protein